MKVCFLSTLDPKDKKSWSGTTYFMYKSLLNEFEQKIEIIAPIKISFLLKILFFGIDKCSRLLFSKKYNKDHSYLLSKYYAMKIQPKVNKLDCDIIFCPNSPVIARLKTNIPICYLSDTTFNQIKDYYDRYSNLSSYSIKESSKTEYKAIHKSKMIIFPSQWAAKFAVEYYGVSQKKVSVVKLGANIEAHSLPLQIKRAYNSTINFLFLGVDWERKGGDIVFETFEELYNQGYNISLTVCGCVPPEKTKHIAMKVIPFLDKNIKEEYEEFNQLMNESHFLFVPTRAECYGLVFCEASAYGIPSISTKTGGVTSIIQDGVNGITLSLEAKPIDYVNQIKLLLDDKKLIKEMAINARAIYEEELNWGTWGKKMKQILESNIS